MTAECSPAAGSAPIGIFDSGIGGLSVLRHVQQALPCENLIYFADSGFAPYGEKSEAVITERCLAIAEFFLERRIKLLVVACNSATAAAVTTIRNRYPNLPVVGVEPGLKPSSLSTRSGVVGVLATAATLSSHKFNALLAATVEETGVRFVLQACNGLANQVERGELYSPATVRLLRQYVEPLLAEHADTLVLGCTHYPFVRPAIEDIIRSRIASPVHIIDTGEPVTRQVIRRLADFGRLSPSPDTGSLEVVTTGSVTAIASAFQRLLNLTVAVHSLA